jgi:fructose-1,6-bisphosphatase/inositol monophosphatase family enzyme
VFSINKIGGDVKSVLNSIIALHNQIRDAVVESCESISLESISSIVKEEEGDTIYAIDRVSEELLLEYIDREIAVEQPVVLIAEGINGGKVVLPESVDESAADLRIIVDPIDGTRGLMYQKRSAWILTGVAPNKGPLTNLQDIELAVQTEIPLVKQYLSDQIWAIKGQGVSAVRYNRLTGEENAIYLHPSRSQTIAHGFAAISRFFPGARDELAAIDEEIVLGALGPVKPGKAHCFEDQYICSGGQLYELMAGHDRFVADLRPLMEPLLARKGLTLGICCHPYDVCTELIARELGVVVTDENGDPLCSTLSVTPDVSWVGYANEVIRQQVEGLLKGSLRRRGLIEPQ